MQRKTKKKVKLSPAKIHRTNLTNEQFTKLIKHVSTGKVVVQNPYSEEVNALVNDYVKKQITSVVPKNAYDIQLVFHDNTPPKRVTLTRSQHKKCMEVYASVIQRPVKKPKPISTGEPAPSNTENGGDKK